MDYNLIVYYSACNRINQSINWFICVAAKSWIEKSYLVFIYIVDCITSAAHPYRVVYIVSSI